MRIAIIGGTFDPIHNGHVQMANYVLSHHYCDEVYFMVAKDTPLKKRKLSSFEDRCAMCRFAIAPYEKMRVSTLEAQFPGVSYSIQTVSSLHTTYPQHDFIWLIGGDQATQLHKWKEIDKILSLIDFYVFPRGQEKLICEYPVRVMDMALMDVSSSEIRQGKKRYYVDKKVKQYIAQHALYVDEFIQGVMSEQRYLHSVSVANLCVHFAKIHGVDEQKAYLAGILHDACKEWSHEKSAQWMKQMHPQLLKEHPNIWHAYIASTYLPHCLDIYDKEVLRAIFHHVKGEDSHPLSMILYSSDKLDPLRGYDSLATIKLCEKNLKLGYEEVMRQQRKFLKKERLHEK